MKYVAASGELSAPLTVAEAIQADDAAGIWAGFGSGGDTEAGEVVDVGVGAGAEAKAVEGAAEEEEGEEEESGETEEEEEKGGEEEHDDGFEEEGKEVGVWF